MSQSDEPFEPCDCTKVYQVKDLRFWVNISEHDHFLLKMLYSLAVAHDSIRCLFNQLDAGVPEKISLVSRDEKSVLVVTYSDLKRCFDSTFQELQAAAAGSL